MSTQLIKPNYLVILPPTQHHSFFRNLPPLIIMQNLITKLKISLTSDVIFTLNMLVYGYIWKKKRDLINQQHWWLYSSTYPRESFYLFLTLFPNLQLTLQSLFTLFTNLQCINNLRKFSKLKNETILSLSPTLLLTPINHFTSLQNYTCIISLKKPLWFFKTYNP